MSRTPTKIRWEIWAPAIVGVLAIIATLASPWITRWVSERKVSEALVLRAGAPVSSIEILFPDGTKITPSRGQFRVPDWLHGREIIVMTIPSETDPLGRVLGSFSIPEEFPGIFKIELDLAGNNSR